MISPALLGVIASSRQPDPFFEDVILLLPGYGADGATNIVDASSYANTLSRNDASFSSVTSKFGTTSMTLNTSSLANRITVADSALWDLGTGDWTIEGWFYSTDATSGSAFSMLWSGGITGTYMRLSGGSVIQYFHNGGGNTTGTLTTNSWEHWAACKASDVVRFFRNGVVIATRTLAGSVDLASGLNVGNSTSFDNRWRGYIEQFRVTKGVARYPSAFTPPDGPFPTF